MIDPGRTIERQPYITLIIGIVSEGLALGIEVDAVGIAETAVHRLPHDFAIDDGVPDPVTEFLRRAELGRGTTRGIGGDLDVVASDEMNRASVQGEIVATMTGSAYRGLDQRGLVELIIAIRVAQGVERLAIVCMGVERVARPGETAAFFEGVFDGLDRDHFAAIAGESEAQNSLLLLTDEEAPLRIDRETDPRILALRGVADFFDFESRRQRRERRGLSVEGLFPLIVFGERTHVGQLVQRPSVWVDRT